MIDPNVWRQRREDIMREAEQDRLASALRVQRKKGADHTFLFKWELKRIVGLVIKFFRSLNKPGNGARL